MKIEFDKLAQAELLEAALFYRDCEDALAREFLAAVERLLVQLSQMPLLGAKFGGRYRRCIVRRFPYAIIYSVEKDGLFVTAVMHLKRKPDYWAGRNPGC